MKIEGRTFAITGGASGLGRACAVDLVRHGGNVVILDLNEEQGQALAKELGEQRARFFAVDVSDEASLQRAARQAGEWIKETRRPLGGVIAAAGVGNPGMIIDRHGTPLATSNIDFVLSINLRGTLLTLTAFLPLLLSSTTGSSSSSADGERGVLILVSSAAAFEGQRGQAVYAASKGAVASLALPLARDLSRHGVRAVAIAPGVFESGMTAIMAEKVKKSLAEAREFPKRDGTGEEFASAVRQVIENVMWNGAVLRLDGAVRLPSKM